MAQTSEDDRAERARLRELARTADSEAERRAAIRRLATLDRERNRDTYDQLAGE
jgi:hypothetical protein